MQKSKVKNVEIMETMFFSLLSSKFVFYPKLLEVFMTYPLNFGILLGSEIRIGIRDPDRDPRSGTE